MVVESIIKGAYEAFIFRKEKKLLYVLDPRTKFILLTAMIIIIVLINTFIGQLIVLSYILLLGIFGYSPSRLRRGLKTIFTVSLFFFIVLYIMYIWLNYTLTNALMISAFLTLRIINLLILFSIVLSSTSPEDLAQFLVKLHIPYYYAYMIVLAIRFVPTVARDIQLVYDAHRARGSIIDSSLNPIRRLKSLVSLLISSFTVILNRVDSIAEALESRCFGFTNRRTFMNEIRIKKVDVVFITLTIPTLIILYYLITLIKFP